MRYETSTSPQRPTVFWKHLHQFDVPEITLKKNDVEYSAWSHSIAYQASFTSRKLGSR